MAQEEVGTVPQRATLVRRAHELLESLGEPATEEQLIQHLFGASNSAPLWTVLLRKTLRGSALFEESGEIGIGSTLLWSLKAWRVTQQLLEEVDFVVIDTETTGLRPGPDRVIEIAAVRVRGGVSVGAFQTLLNPQRSIPPFIIRFTGISPEMVQDAPTSEAIFPEFLQFIEGATLVGHNLGFDLNFLAHEARLLRRSFPVDGFDTIPLARRLLPGLKRFKLDYVADHLHISTVQRHRAMGDAKVTAAVFIRLLELAKEQGIFTVGLLKRRVQLPVAWNGDIHQVETKGKGWRADGKMEAGSTAVARPTGSLFLNVAWKQDFAARPGVYLMKDANGQVIYVGKAKNLKNRLNSYYSQPLGYTRKMDGLLQSVAQIETRVLGSELEALLVESQLIKELQPAYNVQLRNYELYPFIKIDVQHAFPRVYASREVAADGARYFGPFRSRHLVNTTIELIQKIFPIRTCTRGLPPQTKPSDPCLRLHLDRCPGPCRGGVESNDYQKTIADVCAFLGGEREDLLDRLRRQMFEAAQNLNFERAAWLRDAVKCADEILIGQRLITGAVEANNLFIVYPSAEEGHNELFLIRHGRLVAQRRVLHELALMQQGMQELLNIAKALGQPPDIVGKAEVDQINIISRWIHRHSDDRAFFPLQQALSGEQQEDFLAARIWEEVNVARLRPLDETEDDIAAEIS
jgi:DNA polymerase III subunit epsilon